MLLRISLVAFLTGVGLAASGVSAAAAPSVDVNTLVPAPPPGATCHAAGARVICRTNFDNSVTNGEAFVLPCGQVYETADDVRRGLRWYEDGRLVRRFVFQNASGSWSLSSEGTGPTVTWTAHANWQNVDVDAQADEETWPTTYHGMQFRINGRDGRPILQYTGIERPDGSHSGAGEPFDPESPAVQAALCAALATS